MNLCIFNIDNKYIDIGYGKSPNLFVDGITIPIIWQYEYEKDQGLNVRIINGPSLNSPRSVYRTVYSLDFGSLRQTLPTHNTSAIKSKREGREYERHEKIKIHRHYVFDTRFKLMLDSQNIIKAMEEERLQRIKAGAFLASVTGISAIIGFSATLSTAKKSDPKFFSKGLHGSAELGDAGAILALRALGWGTLYAITGTGFLCYGIWKLSGAKDLKDFRTKMGNLLPTLPKNNPPQSRTEFSGLNDFLTYISEEYGKKSVKEK